VLGCSEHHHAALGGRPHRLLDGPRGTRRQIDDDVDALPLGSVQHSIDHVLGPRIERVMSPELTGDLQATVVGHPAHQDGGHAGGRRRDHAPEAVLAWALDQDAPSYRPAADVEDPSQPVRDRNEQGRQLVRDAVADAMHDRVGVEVEELAETTPQRGGDLYRGRAVAKERRLPAGVGGLAETATTGTAPPAVAARQELLDDDSVADRYSPSCGGIVADRGDTSDVLVPQDHGAEVPAPALSLVDLPVGSADAYDVDIQDAVVASHIGEWELHDLGPQRIDGDRGSDRPGHTWSGSGSIAATRSEGSSSGASWR
jgi:hypothetical protein